MPTSKTTRMNGWLAALAAVIAISLIALFGAPVAANAELAPGTFAFDKISVANAKVTLPKAKYAFTGSAIKPTPKVAVDGVKLEAGADYKVTYSANKNVGKATVKIVGQGSYEGAVKKTFAIVPAKGCVTSALSKLSGNVTVKAKAGAGGKKNEFAISKTKSAAKQLQSKIVKKRTVTFKGLVDGAKYYVFTRSVGTVNGKAVNGKWSKPVAVTVKTHPFVGTWELDSMTQGSAQANAATGAAVATAAKDASSEAKAPDLGSVLDFNKLSSILGSSDLGNLSSLSNLSSLRDVNGISDLNNLSALSGISGIDSDNITGALSGLGGISGISGTGGSNGLTIPDPSTLKALGITVTLTMNKDHTAVVNYGVGKIEGTWTATGATTGTLTAQGQSASASVSGNLLTVDSAQSGAKIVFKRTAR